MIDASWSFFRTHSNQTRLCSSVVEHFIGNEEVTGSIPVEGFGRNALFARLLQIKSSCSGYFCYLYLVKLGAVLAGLVCL
jgi:hypothetical protein